LIDPETAFQFSLRVILTVRRLVSKSIKADYPA